MSDDIKERLAHLVVSAARAALVRQREDGSLPEGHNGPYRDAETPVRNTAHWSIIFLGAWRQTGDAAFREAAECAAAYLLSPAARPVRGAFFCRRNPMKDETNGLIGQAWAIEALAEVGLCLHRPDLVEAASSVFLLHRYENIEGGWRRAALDGRPIAFDRTFNHQLWFCAAGALLVSAGVEKAEPPVRDFITHLPSHMKLYPSGLIRHVTAGFLTGQARNYLAFVARGLRNASRRSSLRIKAIGYHAFNTYALALMQRALPDLHLVRERPVTDALRYLMSADYFQSVAISPYGFPYNPPGFEAAFTLDTFFPDRQELVNMWLKRELDESYDVDTGQIKVDKPDPATSAARLYEACRLLWPFRRLRLPVHDVFDVRVGRDG